MSEPTSSSHEADESTSSMRRSASRWPLVWPAEAWHPIFFDLALVAVVLAISGGLSTYPSPGMALWLSMTFAAIWLSWAIVMLTEPLHPVGVRRVGVMALQMGALLVAAVAADDTMADNTRAVGLALAVAVWATVPLLRLGRIWADRNAAAWVAVSGLMWALSTLLWASWWFLATWVAALAAMGLAARSLTVTQAGQSHRIAHRFGELTIVVIGEGFLKIALVGSSGALTRTSGLVVAMAIAVATLVWWGYFILPERVDRSVGDRGLVAWGAGHLVLHLGLIGLAVGLAKAMTYKSALPAYYGVGLLEVPITLIALGMAGVAHSRRANRATMVAYLSLALCAVVVAAAVALGWLGPMPAVALLIGALGVLVVREARRTSRVAS